jgi:hypothetical protein
MAGYKLEGEMNNSNLLRDEALEIIEEYDLFEILGRYGDARLVGSVALDLVVKPDIDIHLYIDKSDVVQTAEAVKDALIANQICTEIRVSEYLEKNSLKLGIDSLPGRSTDWSIDIWVTSDFNTTGFEETERINRLLNDKTREKILELKQYYFKKGQLRDGLSLLIYKSVLEMGVSGLDEFLKYLDEIQPGTSN